MGVTLMENYELGAPTALAEKGWTQTTGITNSISTFTENGVNRKALRSARALNANSFYPIGIPIPSSKVFYFSTRVRWTRTDIPDAGLRLYFSIGTAFNAPASSFYAFAMPVGGKWTVYAGGGNAGPGYTFGYDWVTIEIARKADGTIRVWANDLLLYTAGLSVTTPAANFLYMGWAQSGGSSGGSIFYGWEFADTVVVDPATPGLQNRPGSASRVLSVPFTADVTAQWSLPAGVTGPHYPFMADYPAAVDPNRVLTGDTVGQREQYQAGAVPVAVPGANKVLSLQIEQRPSNLGGSPHTFATELDAGAGIVEVAQNQLAGASGFVYRPVFLDKKPDGSNWTAADVAALKAGFSIKS